MDNMDNIDIENKDIKDETVLENNYSTDPFWINDYKILFYNQRLTDFFPTINMTIIEKLNAIFRLSVYLSIILYLFTSNYLYLYIMIIVGLFTVFIFYNQKDNIELYFNSDGNDPENSIIKSDIDKQKNIINPTTENPFMNINLITDNKEKKEAPPSWNNENIQKDIEDKFGYNLYRDVGDLYGKSNSQREFYTMPSTTIPNNQTSFAKWCYSVGPTCKEKSIYCTPEMNQVPYIDTSNTTLFNDVKY
jgi:hypothetical protein